MKVPYESEIDESQLRGSASALNDVGNVGTAARAGVVNRTHRVVRHRAKEMQERRSYVRSLMAPLAICSALLILTVVAVWSGLFETDAAEAVQDVTSLATTDANNHFFVVMLWFVPVSLALLAAVWFTRFHNNGKHEIGR